jgi:drug/metabolite transporter (DMT)-like permease
MDSSSKRIRLKTAIFVVIVVLSNALGNLFLSWGLKHDSHDLSLSPAGYILAILNPWVMVGVALLILWLLSRMALLSWADLSYVLPVTALGYVASAALGKVFLNEHVTPARWTGTLLIVAGMALVARTAPKAKAEAVDAGKS